MKIDKEYTSLKFALIKVFLIDAYNDILDVSYTRNDGEITIQVVLLEGKTIPSEVKQRAYDSLGAFSIHFTEIFISKNRFNETKGEWAPHYYNWLENVLFSKAEVL